MQKYKVFFNEKRIVFTSDRNITFGKPNLDIDENSSVSRVLDWLQTFATSQDAERVLEHPKPEQLFNTFKSAFLIVDAAGGVVVRNNKLLFIYRNGKWDLPKGKIDAGESSQIAAVREVEEECGISGHKIVKDLPSSFHIYKSPYPESKGRWIFKETMWYEMEYQGNENGIPQEEEGITKVRWFAKNELDEVLENTYGNLKQIINLYRD